MLDRLRTEAAQFGRVWWCRGHGAAVGVTAVMMAALRPCHDVLFWVVMGFLIGHTAMAVRRYLIERRLRAKAVVLASHLPQRTPVGGVCADSKMVFCPTPITSFITLQIPPNVGH